MTPKSTDCEFLFRAAFAPGVQAKFLENPDNMHNILHFTMTDEVKVYREVNPLGNLDLLQHGRVVAISGAGRGVGKATALMFANAGARGVAICARTSSELEGTKREIQDISPNTSVYLQQVDVSNEIDVETFFEKSTKVFGTIDVAVSNAGANSCFQSIDMTETERWWQDVTVNLKGSYLFAKHYIKSLAGKTGTLINVSSCHALAAVPGQTAYCSSKIAAARILEIMHLEHTNLRCFSLHPGAVDTELLHELERKMGLKLHWTWTDPSLTGGTILWLTTERAEFLRGRWISVNWRIDELEAQADKIVEQNLFKLAFNASLVDIASRPRRMQKGET